MRTNVIAGFFPRFPQVDRPTAVPAITLRCTRPATASGDRCSAGAGRPSADVASYLGGVADVLQDKVNRNLGLTHLVDLGDGALHTDDYQIRQPQYAEEHADLETYWIRVRPLNTSAAT